MTEAEILSALESGLEHHRYGRLEEASAEYQRVLEDAPDHGDALHLLGVIAHQQGRHEEAVELIEKAIVSEPDAPEYFNNLGEAYNALGKINEAANSYRRAIDLDATRVDSRFNLGRLLARAGKIDRAIQRLQEVVELKPDFAEAHYHLGLIQRDRGKLDEAIESLRQAAALRPGEIVIENDLGALLGLRGRYAEAEASFRRGLELNPDDASLQNNLSKTLFGQERFEEALAAAERALELRPEEADHHFNHANALQKLGRHEQAAAAYRKAIELKPEDPDYHHLLGKSLRAMSRFSEAIAAFQKAIALKPDQARFHASLGTILSAVGKLDGSIMCFRRAIGLKPDDAELYNSLAGGLRAKRMYDQAVAQYRKALALRPRAPQYHVNLANALMVQGRQDEAFTSYREALSQTKSFPSGHSRLLLALHYRPDSDPASIFAEHRAWAQRYTEPLAANVIHHDNDPDPDRTLRIGYMSADFKGHSVSYFSGSFLGSHSQHVEVVCYSGVALGDPLTRRLHDHADEWRNVYESADDRVIEMIRADKIDILIDLSGHTAGNRMLLFARKPAPVQVSYLGYPDTTGLPAMDYRITDSLADPAGMTEKYHTEELIRLDPCAWCYEPPESPDVEALPVSKAGRITFGSFNDSAKISLKLVALWSKVLEAVPDSRLIVKNMGLSERSTRERMLGMFKMNGIPRERLELLGWEIELKDHLAHYNSVDIALDSFPYHGTTTTCESLWMGAPVITLAGQTHVSRVGVSLLSNVGLADLIASSESDYVRIAASLAADRTRLAELRAGLRQTMKDSPLTDSDGFTRRLEQAYRQMWKRWCATRTAG